MNENIGICPSILSADFANLKEEVCSVQNAGASMLHIDVMDGHFVDNISFGIPIVECISKNFDIPLDVHLMVSNPASFIVRFVESGASSVTFHVESNDSASVCINILKKLRCGCGISLKPSTSVDAIKPYLCVVDLVLVMGVEPGFGGQKFLPEVLSKIKEIKRINSLVKVQVDGGVNVENAKLITDAGASLLVIGSAIFNSGDSAKAIRNFKSIV